MFVGAPLALVAHPLEAPWLFFVGLALLLIALAVPTRKGQTLSNRLAQLVRHLPGARWFRPRD